MANCHSLPGTERFPGTLSTKSGLVLGKPGQLVTLAYTHHVLYFVSVMYYVLIIHIFSLNNVHDSFTVLYNKMMPSVTSLVSDSLLMR